MSDIVLMALAKVYTKEHFSHLDVAEQIRFQDGFVSGYRYAKTEINHGDSGYTKGCRCEICTEARRLSVKKWRKEQKEKARLK